MKDETWSGRITSFLIAFVTLGFQSIEAKTLYTACPIRTCFLSGGVTYFQGYFKDDVLDVEMLQMNANVSVAALAARNIDYNLICNPSSPRTCAGCP